ncbi:vitelline membrane protein 15a-1-like [Armigeres subalbatus]|uniref:vitelline membrane protein 15a-1-like n=1 Tax=Armigeres subalbatus TaxID=124917 RepID=UPI002ED35264
MRSFYVASLLVASFIAGAMAIPQMGPLMPPGYFAAMGGHPHPMEGGFPAPAPATAPANCGSNLLIGCGDPKVEQVPCVPEQDHRRPPSAAAYHYGRHHAPSYHHHRSMDGDFEDAFEGSYEA